MVRDLPKSISKRQAINKCVVYRKFDQFILTFIYCFSAKNSDREKRYWYKFVTKQRIHRVEQILWRNHQVTKIRDYNSEGCETELVKIMSI